MIGWERGRDWDCLWVSINACENQKLTLNVYFQYSPLYVLKQVFSLHLELTNRAGLASELQRSCLQLLKYVVPKQWMQSYIMTPYVLQCCWGFKSSASYLYQAFYWMSNICSSCRDSVYVTVTLYFLFLK